MIRARLFLNLLFPLPRPDTIFKRVHGVSPQLLHLKQESALHFPGTGSVVRKYEYSEHVHCKDLLLR